MVVLNMKKPALKSSLSPAIALLLSAFIMTQNQDTPRHILAVHQAVREDVGEMITYRAMPTFRVSIDQLDPFLLLNHHGPQVYPPHNQGLPFGPHPHRGFETVTFILDGDVAHRNNSGHESVITKGGIQWMTAGSGIIHTEVSSEQFKKEGGGMEVLQLWVNLPSQLKSAKPAYTGLQDKDIPEIEEDDGKVSVNLIAGNWKDRKAPIQSLTGVFMSYLEFKEGGILNTSVDANRSIFLYVVNGSANINGQKVDELHIVEFAREDSGLKIEATEDAVILFGHAEPTHEPVAARGPFVMNTEEEIVQAIMDYQAGKFGKELH